MDWKTHYYPETHWGGFSHADGTIAFYERVNALLEPSFTLLDVGCGRGSYANDPVLYRRSLRILKGKVRQIIGLDVNPSAADNPFLDEFILLPPDGSWPIPANSTQMVLSDHVLEHVGDPDLFFCEANRVLQDGGYFCFRTPNLWAYPALFSRLIPNHRHTNVLQKVKPQLREVDVFPTHYRCNTLPTIRAYLKKYHFEHQVFGFGAEPSYLSFSRLAYGLGVLYQKFAPSFLQPVLFGFARLHKTSPASDTR